MTIAKLAAASSTHSHCIQSDYEDRLAAGDSEEEALAFIAKKYGDKAEHQRRLARGRR